MERGARRKEGSDLRKMAENDGTQPEAQSAMGSSESRCVQVVEGRRGTIRTVIVANFFFFFNAVDIQYYFRFGCTT